VPPVYTIQTVSESRAATSRSRPGGAGRRAGQEILASVAVAQEEHAAHGRASLSHRDRRLGVVGVGEQHPGARVVAEGDVVLDRPHRVQAAVPGAVQPGSDLGEEHLGDVGAQRHDGGAGADAHIVQHLLELADDLGATGVGQPPGAVDEGLATAEAGQRLGDDHRVAGTSGCVGRH
jgi:hypothetical protein